MSGYRVQIEPEAWDVLMQLPERDAKRVFDAIEDLESVPRPAGAKKLSGEDGVYRARVGSYRILYDIYDSELVVLIIKVGNRREVYKKRR